MEIVRYILVIIIANGLFLSVILFLKKGKPARELIPAGAFRYLHSADDHAPFHAYSRPHVDFIVSVLLVGPVSWFLFSSFLPERCGHHSRKWVHLIPAAITFVMYGALVFRTYPAHAIPGLTAGDILILLRPNWVTLTAAAAVSGIAYCVASWKIIRAISEKAGDYFSDMEHFRISWLRALLACIILLSTAKLFYFVTDILELFLPPFPTYELSLNPLHGLSSHFADEPPLSHESAELHI